MPSLSPTMTQGTIAAWKKAPGDLLKPGDILCEIETDKAVVGFEVQDEGVLASILAQPGPELRCGEPIALLVDDEEAYATFLKSGYKPQLSSEPASPATPQTNVIESVAPPVSAIAGERRLSPAAKHMVDSKRLDVSKVIGTSKGGLVSKADVILAVKSGVATSMSKGSEAATASLPSSATPAAASTPSKENISVTPKTEKMSTSASVAANPSSPVDAGSYVDIPNNRMRTVIAKRLTESKCTVPHTILTTQVKSYPADLYLS